MQLITLQPSKSQIVNVILNSQNCKLKIHQRSTSLYMDIYINDRAVALGVLCLNCNFIVRYKYLGFSGDLVFVDTLGSSNPEWSGIGERYKLYYLSPEDLL